MNGPKVWLVVKGGGFLLHWERQKRLIIFLFKSIRKKKIGLLHHSSGNLILSRDGCRLVDFSEEDPLSGPLSVAPLEHCMS